MRVWVALLPALASCSIESAAELKTRADREQAAAERAALAANPPATAGTFSADEARALLAMPRLSPVVRGAPVGMPRAVAARIISKNSKLVCAEVTDAYRVADKSIVARCRGGETYRVGALFEMGQRAISCEEIAPLTQQRPC